MRKLGRIGVIIAARMSSNRLPGKAILKLQGMPMISLLIKRIKTSKLLDDVILATSTNIDDNKLCDIAISENIKVYRGPLDDLITRYVNAAEKYNIDTVIRITGDCPFVNGELVDYGIDYSSNYDFDLCTTKGMMPIGLDLEIFPAKLMSQINKKNHLSSTDREHLTIYIYNNKLDFKIIKIKPKDKWIAKKQTFTVDTYNDYIAARNLAKSFDNPYFSIEDIVKLGNNADKIL